MNQDELIAQTPLGEIRVGIKSDPQHPGIFVELCGAHLNDRFNEGSVRLAWVEYSSEKGCLQTIVYGNGDADDFTHLIEHENILSFEMMNGRRMSDECSETDATPMDKIVIATDEVSDYLQTRWIACYMNYDWNYRHAVNAFDNTQFDYRQKVIERLKAVDKTTDKIVTEIYNRVLSEDIEDLIQTHMRVQGCDRAQVEIGIAEAMAEIKA